MQKMTGEIGRGVTYVLLDGRSVYTSNNRCHSKQSLFHASVHTTLTRSSRILLKRMYSVYLTYKIDCIQFKK